MDNDFVLTSYSLLPGTGMLFTNLLFLVCCSHAAHQAVPNDVTSNPWRATGPAGPHFARCPSARPGQCQGHAPFWSWRVTDPATKLWVSKPTLLDSDKNMGKFPYKEADSRTSRIEKVVQTQAYLYCIFSMIRNAVRMSCL